MENKKILETIPWTFKSTYIWLVGLEILYLFLHLIFQILFSKWRILYNFIMQNQFIVFLGGSKLAMSNRTLCTEYPFCDIHLVLESSLGRVPAITVVTRARLSCHSGPLPWLHIRIINEAWKGNSGTVLYFLKTPSGFSHVARCRTVVRRMY